MVGPIRGTTFNQTTKTMIPAAVPSIPKERILISYVIDVEGEKSVVRTASLSSTEFEPLGNKEAGKMLKDAVADLRAKVIAAIPVKEVSKS